MKAVIATLIAILIVGCGSKTPHIPMASGGSKGDGMVELSYTVGPFDTDEVNWDDADKRAEMRCKAWNYSGAEMFGTGTQRCVAQSEWGCTRYEMTIRYQCVGES